MFTFDKALTIDLTTHEVATRPLDDHIVRHYLGGRGLNIWQLQTLLEPEANPLSPENRLFLSCGLLTGTEVPSASRLHLSARSPQTGILGSSSIGGHVGAALRSVGWHTVQIQGRSERPVYLWIGPHGVEIGEAHHLWGLDTRAAVEALEAQLAQPGTQFLMIGPGGENLVRYACINGGRGHAAGRTGLGAVMGAKRLKAIAITPHPGRRPANPAAKELVRAYALSIREAERFDTYAKYGNSAYLAASNAYGILGTRNFQEAQFEGAEKIDGHALARYVQKSKTCHRCPVHCKAEVRVEHGRFAKLVGERPDIEPLMALGPRIGNKDPEAVFHLYNLTNALGIDVISTGGVLAFAIDLYTRGILNGQHTQGLSLGWGDVESMDVLIRQIANREGLGEILAEGVGEAARRIGGGAERFAYHSKQLELPGYDPRGAQGTALSFAISSRGADYTSVYPTPEFFWSPEEGKAFFGSEKAVDPLSSEGKGTLVKYTSIVSAVLDSLGICKVPILSIIGDFSLEKEAQFAAALTGWELDAETLFKIGQRILDAERQFNLRCGMSIVDDTLPEKFTQEPIPDGPTKGKKADLETMLQEFYQAMGWDHD